MSKRKQNGTPVLNGSSPKAGLYTLRRDRTDPFRRTVNYKSGESAQLVFSADRDIELTDEEVAALEKEINVGMILLSDRDAKGRQRSGPERNSETPVNVGLKSKLEDEQPAE